VSESGIRGEGRQETATARELPYLLSDTHLPPRSTPNGWRPLRFFSLYRIILAGLFLFLAHTGNLPAPLGTLAPELFYWVSVAYLIFALGARITLHLYPHAFTNQVYLQVLADILALTLLTHASGGLGSGLGMLLVVSIAGGSLLTDGRMAGLLAAIATLAVLAEQTYLHLNWPELPISYPQAGGLGALLFATAALAHTLGRRIHESEALAARRGLDLANMAQLTEYIIQHMRTGVLVVDPAHRIRLMNNTAWKLLGQPAERKLPFLTALCHSLEAELTAWERGGAAGATTLQINDGVLEVIPRFMSIGGTQRAGTLVFLEEASAAAQQAQQLKLASLGRLTASIAHEVRNPLGAISHAGELLHESENLDTTEKRLTEIIREQSRRVNTIIDDVLRLGRRKQPHPEVITLDSWLERFIDRFCHSRKIPNQSIRVELTPPKLQALIDPHHLTQILDNLCRNALDHGEEAEPQVSLRGGLGPTGRPYLEVCNRGAAIPEEVAAHIFEPFYTTSAGGTGLGLYISRELAEQNRARLTYRPGRDGGACFRLSFADPQEQQE